MSEADRVEVKVTVDDAHVATLGSVAASLADAGLSVERELGSAGVVTGRAEPAALDALRAVPGVLHVELGETFQLPPPDSEIQ
jgi:hypothetical protein